MARPNERVRRVVKKPRTPRRRRMSRVEQIASKVVGMGNIKRNRESATGGVSYTINLSYCFGKQREDLVGALKKARYVCGFSGNLLVVFPPRTPI